MNTFNIYIVLFIGGNIIENEGAEAISEALKTNQTLQELNLCKIILMKNILYNSYRGQYIIRQKGEEILKQVKIYNQIVNISFSSS